MKSQICIYTIKEEELNTFVEEWIDKIKPLRIKIGFEVSQSWIDKSNNKFIWILTLENDNNWDELEKKYHNSEERKSMNPNPARNILAMENSFVDQVE